jgi:hypothetical protein
MQEISGAPIQRLLRRERTDAYTIDAWRVAPFLIGPGPFYFLLFLPVRLFRVDSLVSTVAFRQSIVRQGKSTYENSKNSVWFLQ